jgi:3-oxoacyl-[acyl-carrier protein] reductase
MKQPRFRTTSFSFAARSLHGTKFPSQSISFLRWLWLKVESWSVTLRNVIVTGGSRGLGLGIARRLSESGFCAIAIARKETDEFIAAKKEAEDARPGSLHFAAFDLAEIDGIPDLVKRLRKDFGTLYGLVNNAGMSADGTLALTSTQKIEQVVRLNTISPMVLSKYVVRLMMADGGGRIVNISSVTAFTGYSGLSVYAATKASLIGFTRSLAREVGRMGVNVNAVAPGFVDTSMTEVMTDEQRQQIERRSALKRLVDVEDVANAVEFLLGDRSKNITGTVLTVDAGNTA